MLFSSTVFIFIFLPLVLTIHFLLDRKFRNYFILLASLFFYAWGEGVLVLLMMGSICFNFSIGVIIEYFQKINRLKIASISLYLGVTANLIVLGYYKYINFFLENLASLGINITLDTSSVTLPIGISFFTFQSISYLVDIHRKTVVAQKDLVSLGMYISLFPQLIAGPIVRYVDISKEIEKRKITLALFKSGVNRFIIGFAKKIIIANNVGLIADKVFAGTPAEISSTLSWIGIICYTLQIYYDFSGYSDMAIGLGKMLGFNFRENFDHPYISKSIKEFWRRWHISLSTWFRDYLYIPLGGNKKGARRTYVNLFLVFLFTGLWHGASWNFIVWGLFHGTFIIIERLNIFRFNFKTPVLSHIYLLVIVMIGWVFFRADDLPYAVEYISRMFSFSAGVYNYPYIYLNYYVILIIFIGLIMSAPVRSYLERNLSKVLLSKVPYSVAHSVLYLVIFIFCIMELAQSTYNPFIYFRF